MDITTVEFTKQQIKEVSSARDALHFAIMKVLREVGVDFADVDLTDAAEQLALEGRLFN